MRESSVDKSASVIRRYSHLQSHHTNEYLANICLEERLGANDNPREQVFEGSVANSRSGHPLDRSALDCTPSVFFMEGTLEGLLTTDSVNWRPGTRISPQSVWRFSRTQASTTTALLARLQKVSKNSNEGAFPNLLTRYGYSLNSRSPNDK